MHWNDGNCQFLEETENNIVLFQGKPLFVGSLLHCKVISEDKMEMMSGENRSIQLTINPREVFRSDVSVSV